MWKSEGIICCLPRVSSCVLMYMLDCLASELPGMSLFILPHKGWDCVSQCVQLYVGYRDTNSDARVCLTHTLYPSSISQSLHHLLEGYHFGTSLLLVFTPSMLVFFQLGTVDHYTTGPASVVKPVLCIAGCLQRLTSTHGMPGTMPQL